MPRLILSLILSTALTSPVWAVQAVHDALSLAKMADGLKMAGQHLQALQSVRGELRDLASVIGNDKIAGALESRGMDLMGLEGFGADLEALGHGDVLDTLNAANQRYRGGRDHSKLLRMKDYASQKLHGLDERLETRMAERADDPLSMRDAPTAPRPTRVRTPQDLDDVVRTRRAYVVEASSLGQAMAAQQKADWSKKDLKRLKALAAERQRAQTVVAELDVANKLLELQVQQNNTRNLLLAQILDNLSAMTAQMSPVVFKQASPRHAVRPTSSKASGVADAAGALKLLGAE